MCVSVTFEVHQRETTNEQPQRYDKQQSSQSAGVYLHEILEVHSILSYSSQV